MDINYFDNASTTKIDSRVLESMLPYFTEIYGNASSNHEFGKTARLSITKSKNQIASLLNAQDDSDIIFTSGSTESINLALKGFLESNLEKGNHIITAKTEHKAVLSTCEYLEERGVEITYLNVNRNGLISLEELKKAIKEKTVLISIMYVNNETGVVQPIKEIGEIAKQHNIVFFSDATQAVGKISVDVVRDNIDMLCISGHKINGPKGIGILYIRKGIELTPLIHGGGQEKGLRGGTYNTPLIVGLGTACEINQYEAKQNNQKLIELYSYITQELNKINVFNILDSNIDKAPSILNVLIPGINSEVFVAKSNDVFISNGSACTSHIMESSHVLKAMGYSDEECRKFCRISFDNSTSKKQIDFLINKIKAEIK